VLKTLYQFRDSIAQAQNRPSFKVISHQALIEMAETCPKHSADLLKLSALHESQAKRYGRGLLEAIRTGQHAPPVHPPNYTRPHNAVLNRIDALQEWRKDTGKDLGVPSDVVLPRDVLNRIAWANPGDIGELQAQMQDVPYRFNRFGQDILTIIT
jgi:ribonuclease D